MNEHPFLTMKTNTLKTLGLLALISTLLTAILEVSRPAPVQRGTASDPALQQDFSTAKKGQYVITDVFENRATGRGRIAFLRDINTGKFSCVDSQKKPGNPGNHLVDIVDKTFCGPLNVNRVRQEDTPFPGKLGWLHNPKYPNLWVLGLVED